MDTDDLTDDLESMSFNSSATTTTATADSTINRSTSSSSETTWTTSSSSFPRSSTKHHQHSEQQNSHPSSTANPCWDAILRSRSSAAASHLLPPLSFSDIRFICRLGSGDIGSVFLSDLKSAEGVYFAAKVMDQKELAARNKQCRAKTEREILEMLDHPFLPTLYAAVESPKWSCLLTEFCPGGDLHVLRQRQPFKRFEESAVRFYASEVVVALEYIHMMGIVYRDLKPENVLVRSDGHIMLTDFDLSLKCDVASTPTPQIILSSTSNTKSTDSKQQHSTSSSLSQKPPQCASASSCILPHCMVPSISCFTPAFSRRRRKNRLIQRRQAGIPSFVAEPVDVRSMSFVGTHEYLAPEIVSGEGHGSAVDWWTLGVFMFELFYGVTPFRGVDNELTLANIVARALEFPKEPSVPNAAKDLISQLLIKDPDGRLGSLTGASMIKQHPFFHGVNWALLRCTKPPFVPPPFSVRDVVSDDSSSSDTPVDYY